ncbi:chemotaxis protein CheA [Cellvibrio zantedeschiae]|uniref:Chemotaxis protein CheA n=1 Tax=Cellvibrio zantedeschiae TaxID=1237077 RepID=A0ABQ3AR48_9GAMM|nr:chemotaxis protein CheA [Cellvibrio zantedeschiae]GGY63086.1 chemotaxis protein CheA [Cellvibrio zantedeschiae]
MSIDMKQFHSVFFDESQEHLDEMEHLLLDLNTEDPDAEELNSIFRAAHSIKGGSGIFGFDALGSVTHIMESLLDKVRQGKLAINPSMVDLFLSSVDVLKGILDSYKSGNDIDWLSANKICERLESVTQPKEVEPEIEGFGLFVEPEIDVEDGFGFFGDPLLPSQEDAYGFFDEEIVPVSKPSRKTKKAPAKQNPSEQKNSTGEISNQALAPASESITENTSATISEKEALLKEVASAPVTKTKTTDGTASENSSIRVDVTKVDQLINLVGEIVITQSMLNLIGKSIDGALGEKFQSVAAELERNTREIQEAVMSIRMLPVSFVFNRFPRVVRDLSTKLGKSIDLIIEGGDTELDKGLTEKLVDPLTHLVRNSIDHGIESNELRADRNKNPTGKVILKAAQQGGSIVISISDDGGGLNREKILAKAREKNIPIGDSPSDSEVWQLIFAPGFSTAAQITDVSGRGVGLDVVKRNVQSLGGRIDIESQEGLGATFTIRLPLTLAIVDGMCVSVGNQTFIIPLVNIVESMQPLKKDIKTLVGDDQLLLVRDQYWPILPLYKAMQLEPQFTEPHQGIAVLIEANKHRFALFVDGLVGQQQVVIKSLEQHYKRVQGVAGATIMGDGSVALILDVESLAVSAAPNSLQQAS